MYAWVFNKKTFFNQTTIRTHVCMGVQLKLLKKNNNMHTFMPAPSPTAIQTCQSSSPCPYVTLVFSSMVKFGSPLFFIYLIPPLASLLSLRHAPLSTLITSLHLSTFPTSPFLLIFSLLFLRHLSFHHFTFNLFWVRIT